MHSQVFLMKSRQGEARRGKARPKRTKQEQEQERIDFKNGFKNSFEPSISQMKFRAVRRTLP